MQTKNSRRRAAARVSGAVVGAVAMLAAGWSSTASANPYATGVEISGTTVNFTLNEAADSLTVSINGGAPQVLDGSTKGLKSFSLTSPTDKFTIVAKKNDSVGYTVPTGGTVPVPSNAAFGLSQPTAQAGFRQISDDANNLVKFNSPRGVTVALNPNQANFGTAYVANSAAATTGRLVGDGLYALKADQSDAFNYGDTAKVGSLTFAGSSSAPWRLTAGPDGNVYIADFYDGTSQVARMSGNLSSSQLLLAATGGPSTLPPGQNHGSTTAIYAEVGAGGLTLYTLDEDLTTSQVTGSGSTSDKNSLWKYSIGNSALPYSDMPTRVNQAALLLPAANSDLDRGADGKFYLQQTRQAGNEAGLYVLGADGTLLYDSLTASRALLGDSAAKDILTNTNGMAVSPDQKYIAFLLNDSDVAVVPLLDGIPQLAQRVIVDTGTDINSGRDIAFDAADNIHYVSSGQGLYRVLSPGGDQITTLSYDGSSFSFANGAVPEPGSLALVGAGALMLMRRKRRR